MEDEEISELLQEKAREKGLSIGLIFSNLPLEVAYRQREREKILATAKRRALELLRSTFGSAARFQVNRKLRPDTDKKCNMNYWPKVDFYFKKSRLAIIITGPRKPDFQAWDKKKHLNDKTHRAFYSSDLFSPLPSDVKVLYTPYYEVLRTPKKFIEKVRSHLGL